MKKAKVNIWNSLPKEVRVGVYVISSAALAELVKYLSSLEFDSLIVAAIINVLIVCLQTRVPQIRARLSK